MHDQTICNDHRQGDPPTQCRRTRQKDEELCWFHVKQDAERDYPDLVRGRPNGTSAVLEETRHVEELTARAAQFLDDPDVARFLPTSDHPTTPPGGAQGTYAHAHHAPVSRETSSPTPPAAAPPAPADLEPAEPGAVGSFAGSSTVANPASYSPERRPFVPLRPDQMGALFDPTAAPVDNPVMDLAKIAGILRHAFEQAGHRVNELQSISVETRAGGEQLRGEILLWEKLLSHLRSLLVDMAKLNLEERLVRIDEVRADRVAEALFWLVGSLVARLELDRTKAGVVEELMQATVHRIVTMGTALDSTPALALIRP